MDEQTISREQTAEAAPEPVKNPGFSDDFRQTMVIAKNEVRKFISGKKIILFAILIIGLEALNLIVPYALGSGYDNVLEMTRGLLGNTSLFIIIAAVLFTATSIVSEFEERTALILFTKPVRKISIFLGKLIASIAVVTVFMIAVYLFTGICTLAVKGEIAVELFTSLGLCICGIIGGSGLAILISAIFKKGSTASIMTLVIYLLIFGVISALLVQFANIETWWMLPDAMNSISNCLGYYVIVSYEPLVTKIVYMSAEDEVRDAVVMIVWGIVTSIAGYFIFKKKDL